MTQKATTAPTAAQEWTVNDMAIDSGYWITNHDNFVEVVRCGECERRDKCSDLTNTVYCMWFMEEMKKADFCSYGKRNGGE